MFRLLGLIDRGELEAAGEVVEAEDEVAAPLGRGDMLLETLARRVEEFGMVRFVRAELGEAGQRRRLKVVGGDALRRGIAGVDEGCELRVMSCELRVDKVLR